MDKVPNSLADGSEQTVTIIDRLTQKRERLLESVKDINRILELLDKNPDIKELSDLLAKY